MKFRVTPLNFASAFFIFLAVYIWIYGAKFTGHQYEHMTGTICLVFLLFAFVVFFMDVMFRNFFQDTKKIWIIELSFISLAAVIFFLVR